jgi:uncharacterized protein (DUF302 family)
MIEMYEFNLTLEQPFEQALASVREALGAEQFGVVSEVDVQAVFRAKLGLETEPYRILGACNPGLARRVLAGDPNAGVLLPCNLVVRAEGPARTVVSFADPAAQLAPLAAEDARAVGAEAGERLRRVAERLAGD